jgi:hypothetical protein
MVKPYMPIMRCVGQDELCQKRALCERKWRHVQHFNVGGKGVRCKELGHPRP